MTQEYFILAQSFAAPFFSDESTEYVKADSAKEALEKFAAEYRHPCGLYAANAYASADAMHKGEERLAQWLCNHEMKKQELTRDLPGYSYMGNGPGDFEINHERVKVENPKGGRVVVTGAAKPEGGAR